MMKENHQEKIINDMVSRISLRRIADPEEIANVTAKAFLIAEEGIPGPVVISIPTDVLETRVNCLPRKRVNKIISKTDPQDIKKVVKELSFAKKPTLVAGGELQFSKDSKTLIEKVANKYSLPVLCTYEHQDLIDNDNIHYAGELGHNQGGNPGDYSSPVQVGSDAGWSEPAAAAYDVFAKKTL